jgi:hypothetical protein
MKPPTFADDLAPCANCGEATEYRVKVGVTPLCFLRPGCKQQPQPRAQSFAAKLEVERASVNRDSSERQ